MTASPWERLAAHVERQAEARAFSGRVLVTVGDRAVVDVCAGVADRAAGTPVTERTRFGVASLSKMFTAAAVLIALRERAIGVHTRVQDLLPEPRRPRTMDSAVTVHHLLTHTSGIGDYCEEDEDLPDHCPDYAELWVDRPVQAMLRPDDFLPLYADAAPVAPPGGRFHYSNAGFVLLGALLEEVTGGVFAEVVTDTVLRPAGMADSGYFRSDDAVPDVAPGWRPPAQEGGPWRSNVFAVPVIGGGDGGAHATAGDVDRFLRALASGALLGAEWTGRMLARHVEVDHETWMGYGVYVLADHFGHDGGDPGVESWCTHHPDLDTSVVVLANQERSLRAVYAELQRAVDDAKGAG